MNISPDDFDKIGIDDSAIQSKKEQTTYKIKYVTRYVRQWAIIEAGRKDINQINFIDCMCNAGIYKDGDFCTGMEVIRIFNDLAQDSRYASKKFVVFLNDLREDRIKNFITLINGTITKSRNLKIFTADADVNNILDDIANATPLHRELFKYGSCSLIYVDPYSFGTVQIPKLHNILKDNYCELLFNFFTSDFNRNKNQDRGRIQRCLGDLKPKDRKQVVDDVVRALKVGKIEYVYLYSFRTVNNAELYQILYATPSLKGLKALKDSIWDVFNGEEYHRNHSNIGQLSMFTTEDIKMLNLQEYEQEAQHIVCESFRGQIIPFEKIEKKILLETMLKDSQIINYVLKPLIDEGKVVKQNIFGKSNFKKDSYAFI